MNPPDPVGYVKSLNVYRRHLTPSQLSMVAARFRGYYDRQARERQGQRSDLQENLPECQQARDAAGKAVGVTVK